MKGRRIVAGEVLIREGDIGEELFLLRNGSCDVVKGAAGAEVPVAVLSAGDFFGERALISGERRNATVIGREPGLVYTLDKSTFELALKSSPAFHDQMLQSYFGRS
jgi:putative ABC transport system ATP-binding protein